MLRYLEYRSRPRRLLSVVKVHDSGFDPASREFVIAVNLCEGQQTANLADVLALARLTTQARSIKIGP